MQGQPLAGPWSAVWLFWKGDLEMFKDLGLGDYNAVNICGLCWADTRLIAWNDFRACAAWRLRQHTLQEWRDRFLNQPHTHPALQLSGVSVHSVAYDTMHVVDLNGISAHCLGNLFAGLIRNRELGNANIPDGVQRLNQLMEAFGKNPIFV